MLVFERFAMIWPKKKQHEKMAATRKWNSYMMLKLQKRRHYFIVKCFKVISIN